jgi:hypothetical protein
MNTPAERGRTDRGVPDACTNVSVVAEEGPALPDRWVNPQGWGSSPSHRQTSPTHPTSRMVTATTARPPAEPQPAVAAQRVLGRCRQRRRAVAPGRPAARLEPARDQRGSNQRHHRTRHVGPATAEHRRPTADHCHPAAHDGCAGRGPNLVGMTAGQAKTALSRRGLRWTLAYRATRREPSLSRIGVPGGLPAVRGRSSAGRSQSGALRR